MCEEKEGEKENEILEELYRIREEFALRFNCDIGAIFDHLREWEREHPERMANLPSARREPQPGEPRAA